jgi:hypothetical protein
MKNLNKLRMVSVLMAATLAASAGAAQVQFNVPDNLPIAKSMLSRAEVTADFLVWRASGLYDLNHQGNRFVDTSTPEYERATAKYSYLRASPQFTALVDRIKRGGPLLIAASR